jgi:Flp pilus assembly protein TadG
MKRRLLLHLFRDEAGNALVETAIAAPFFAALLAGATDLSNAYAQKVRIQQAAARSIELATASGYNGSAFSTLQTDAATAASVDQSNVIVDKWLECAGVRQTSFTGVCTTGQLPARYVSISVFSSYRPLFAFAVQYARMSTDGTIALSGYSAVRIQ